MRCVRWRLCSGKIVARISGLLFLLQPVRAEWTLTAYLGGAHTAQSSLRLQAAQLQTDLLLQPISYQTKPFQSPLYYGYRVGYFFSRNFGLESEFTHLKVYAETDGIAYIAGTLHGVSMNETASINTVVQRFNITHGVNLLTANLVARKAFRQAGSSARFLLSGRVGGGATIPHPENEVLGISNNEHYEVGAPAWQVGAGLEVRLWHRLYADSELKYTRTHEKVDIAQGTAESPLKSTHAVVGLVWHL